MFSMLWSRFWEWYNRHLTESLLLTALIVYIQIPHMIWNADLYLELNVISKQHFLLDFFFYGIDFIEVLVMIQLGFLIYNQVRNKRNAQSK